MASLLANRYQIGSQLGEGGMGTVYRALDRLTGQTVALKQMQTLYNVGSAQEKALRLALANEFKVLASLRHPNIVGVLDYGFDRRHQPYFTMQFLEGVHSFTSVRTADGSDLSLADKLTRIYQVLMALDYLHRRQILHRDIKPSNVLVNGTQVYVLDFGLSGVATQEAQRIASIPYAAPEILLDQPASIASDLYAVGMMAFELLTGQYPFNAATYELLTQQIVQDPIDMGRVPGQGRLMYWLETMLAKKPHQRFPDAADAIQALSRAVHIAPPEETIEIRESFLQAAKFVGRERELDTLSASLERAIQSGQGGAWLIAGESGVGKSRLIDEIRTLGLVEGALVLRGQSMGAGRIGFFLWRNIIRRLILTADLTDEEAVVMRRIVPDVDELLGRKLPEFDLSTTATIQEDFLPLVETLFRRQMGLEDAPMNFLRRVLRSLTASQRDAQPILLILEDLQDAGSENLALLNNLITLSQTAPLLIIGSYREDEAPGLPQQLPGAQVMRLKRLGHDHIAELSASMLGQSGERPELIALLEKETEGNVFFLVEVMRALAQEGGGLGNVAVTATGRQASSLRLLTGGIKLIVERRLRSLPTDDLTVLQTAAVMGRRLDFRVLRFVHPDWDVERWLTACANAAILEAQDNDWQFSHDKLREGLLDNLEREQAAALHGAVAGALETVYLHAKEQIPRLAYHWAQAGDVVKEGHYAAQAGEQAMLNGAYAEAATFFRRGLELTEGDKKQASLYQQLGLALRQIGDYAAAEEAFTLSLESAERAAYKWGVAEAHNGLGYLYLSSGLSAAHLSAAEDAFKRGLAVAMSVRAQAPALASIVGLASISVERGERDNPAVLLVFAYEHIATPRESLVWIRTYLRRLEAAGLDGESIQAQARGRNFNEIAAALLR